MTSKTHIQLGLIFGSAYACIYPIVSWKESIAYLSICALSSTFPDIDSPHSFISGAIFGIDEVFRKIGILKHRNLSHFNYKFLVKSKFMIALLRYITCFGLLMIVPFCGWILVAFLLGYVSHILLDYATSYFKIKTGSALENQIIYNILGILSILGIIFMFWKVTI